jgi:hypothetical protein
MTQRTRRSRGWALAALAAFCVHAEASAQVAKPAQPAAKPALAPRTAARNPQATARSLAALARFANGQLGDSAYDKRIAAALGKLPNAKAIARRIVGPYETLSPSERAQIFTGVAGLDKLTTRPYDRAAADKLRDSELAKAIPMVSKTVLAPDVPTGKGSYGLAYRGMTVHKGADADGTDEPVVFTTVFWPGSAEQPYQSVSRTLPETGTLGVANGASSGASAGDVWSTTWWPGDFGGILLLSAVLEDNGDLAQRKEDINLLIAFAMSETAENTGTNRMLVLRQELEDTLELLHLANHQYWDSKAVQVRLLTSADYDQLYDQAPVATPFPHRLTMRHNPRGADYTLYFDIPVPQVTWRTVSVTIKQLEALGSGRDAKQNQLADFGVDVRIDGNTGGFASQLFPGNKNLVKTSWTVERQIQAGSNVKIHLAAWDRDPTPKFNCLDFGCSNYCADLPDPNQTGAYAGRCPPRHAPYDINERPPAYTGWCLGCLDSAREIDAVFDLGSNTLSGDINGPAGTYTLTGNASSEQARVIVEISQK